MSNFWKVVLALVGGFVLGGMGNKFKDTFKEAVFPKNLVSTDMTYFDLRDPITQMTIPLSYWPEREQFLYWCEWKGVDNAAPVLFTNPKDFQTVYEFWKSTNPETARVHAVSLSAYGKKVVWQPNAVAFVVHDIGEMEVLPFEKWPNKLGTRVVRQSVPVQQVIITDSEK